ncbi:choline transporter-like protein 1 [Ruditapes philippinarum]|uniref:choline transporter-like protein 1 n=1 Tax=Ruditapes philippinarum TaxID=129788 RepID=UPI00295AE9B9|nr:choline transporter-like protein 1 [Ruditapes philippinarum]
MGLVSWRAVTIGNPYRLVYGIDSYGNICNQDNKIIDGVIPTLTGIDLRGIPNLFNFEDSIVTNVVSTVQGNVKSTKICVSKCPSTAINSVLDMQNLANINNSRLCVYDIKPSAYFDGSSGTSGCPALPITPQEEFLYRCIPASVTKRIDHVTSAINSLLNVIEENLVEKGASDIQNTWFEMSLLCALAVVVSVVLALLLQFVAWFIVWLMVVSMVIGTLVATILCWYHYYYLRKSLDAMQAGDASVHMKKKVRDWLIGSICVTVFTIVVLLIILALRKHLKLVEELFRQAGKAIRSMPFLLIHPFMTLICLGGTFGCLVWVLLYIETAGTPVVDQVTKTVEYVPDKILTVLKWYYIFGIIWIVQVILACHKMTVAGAVVKWYFTRDKEKLSLPVARSMWHVIRYHFGSIALGSLIITFVMFVRMVLSFIENRLRGGTNPVVVFLLKCLKCCLWCFEKFLKFLNNNAYIEIAIHGHGFCKAARQAFHVVLTNTLRLAAINSVGDFVLFIGKIATVAVITIVGIEFISVQKDIHFVWLPVALVAIFAYFIAGCFMSVYEMTIDTIFICFCEDSVMNDGDSKPFFMSVGLQRCMSAGLKKEQPKQKILEGKTTDEKSDS